MMVERELQEIGMTNSSGRIVPLNALALALSLAHFLVDWHIGLFGASSESLGGVQAALIGLVCFVYAWWGVSLAAAAQGARAGLLSLATLSAGWSLLGNGLPIAFCPPPCASAFPYQDLAHVGNLVFGTWAAYACWRAARASEQPPARTAWMLPGVALVAVVALFVLLTWASA